MPLLFSEMDKDGDGTIDESEFVECITGTQEIKLQKWIKGFLSTAGNFDVDPEGRPIEPLEEEEVEEYDDGDEVEADGVAGLTTRKSNNNEPDETESDEEEETAVVVMVLEMAFPKSSKEQRKLKIKLKADVVKALGIKNQDKVKVKSLRAGSVVAEIQITGEGAGSLGEELKAQIAEPKSKLHKGKLTKNVLTTAEIAEKEKATAARKSTEEEAGGQVEAGGGSKTRIFKVKNGTAGVQALKGGMNAKEKEAEGRRLRQLHQRTKHVWRDALDDGEWRGAPRGVVRLERDISVTKAHGGCVLVRVYTPQHVWPRPCRDLHPRTAPSHCTLPLHPRTAPCLFIFCTADSITPETRYFDIPQRMGLGLTLVPDRYGGHRMGARS
jgi:hypothetical protein